MTSVALVGGCAIMIETQVARWRNNELVQERGNSIAIALELRLSGTNPLTYA